VRDLPLPPEYAVRSVPALLADRAAAAPEAVAVRARSGGDRYETLSFRQLHDESRAVAAGLAQHGVRAGDRVAWLFDNRHGLDALVLYHAVLAIGAVNVPINTRLTPREVAHIVEHSNARLVVASELAEVAVDRPVSRGLPRGTGVEPIAIPDTQLANILYTSGTTGTPKGVELSHGASLAAAITWSDAFRLGADDVLQSPFPIFSGAGLHFNALSCLVAGATVVVDQYETAASLALVHEVGATVYVAVPSIYAFWLDHLDVHPAELPSLRILDFGGAAMPPAMIERLRLAVPGAGLVQSYGLTEAGPGGTYLPAEHAIAKLGSIGDRGAGPFTEVRVLDGELLLRGPSVMEGYHRDPAATSDAFVDGWLRTGDVVRVDEDGFFFHIDRKKDIIVRGGFNIGSVEVEAALVSHPAVAEAAVVGVPHDRLGEDVHAYVVLRPGATVDAPELVAHCRPLLADFKRPRHIDIVPDLPHNAAGKVRKAELRARLLRATRGV
jgi:acyl-CoA synthetase (AMP-forming)/AMP-acid ligase II